jgi:hypothetical protein
MYRCSLAIITVVATVALGACARDDAGRAARQERRQFQIVMESKLRQLDRGIAKLGGVALETDSSYSGDIENLKGKQLALREKMAIMGTVSDEAWPSLRDSVEINYHDIRAHYGALAHREPDSPMAPPDSSNSFSSALPH